MFSLKSGGISIKAACYQKTTKAFGTAKDVVKREVLLKGKQQWKTEKCRKSQTTIINIFTFTSFCRKIYIFGRHLNYSFFVFRYIFNNSDETATSIEICKYLGISAKILIVIGLFFRNILRNCFLSNL